jgi:hypothetical protein
METLKALRKQGVLNSKLTAEDHAARAKEAIAKGAKKYHPLPNFDNLLPVADFADTANSSYHAVRREIQHYMEKSRMEKAAAAAAGVSTATSTDAHQESSQGSYQQTSRNALPGQVGASSLVAAGRPPPPVAVGKNGAPSSSVGADSSKNPDVKKPPQATGIDLGFLGPLPSAKNAASSQGQAAEKGTSSTASSRDRKAAAAPSSSAVGTPRYRNDGRPPGLILGMTVLTHMLSSRTSCSASRGLIFLSHLPSLTFRSFSSILSF